MLAESARWYTHGTISKLAGIQILYDMSGKARGETRVCGRPNAPVRHAVSEHPIAPSMCCPQVAQLVVAAERDGQDVVHLGIEVIHDRRVPI